MLGVSVAPLQARTGLFFPLLLLLSQFSTHNRFFPFRANGLRKVGDGDGGCPNLDCFVTITHRECTSELSERVFFSYIC